MKFLHTSDLHIGKRLNGVQLIEDQKYILSQIIKIAEEEKADAIVAIECRAFIRTVLE